MRLALGGSRKVGWSLGAVGGWGGAWPERGPGQVGWGLGSRGRVHCPVGKQRGERGGAPPPVRLSCLRCSLSGWGLLLYRGEC